MEMWVHFNETSKQRLKYTLHVNTTFEERKVQ